MIQEIFLNGELILSRKETHGKGKQLKSEPVFTSRIEKHEFYKSISYFDIRNVLDVKGVLKQIRANWNTYVSQVHQWIQKSAVKKLVVTGIFTVVFGLFASTANAGFIKEYTYQVKSGENIENIAAEHGVTAQEILDANGLSSIDGKKILLPKVQDRMVTATVLNVRSEPNTISSVIGKYKKGDVVKVAFEENGWAGILIKGRLCFVSAYYLTLIQGDEPAPSQTAKTMYVNATSLNVRAAASTSSAIIGSLKLNEPVTVISSNNGWSQITFKGQTAFVSEQYITKNEPANKINDALKDTNSNALKQGTEPAPSQTAKTMYVNATSLNVRAAASTSSAIIGSLKLNDPVTVISSNNGWSQITFKGQTAFVSEKYITKNEPTNKIDDALKNTNSYTIKSGDTFTKIGKTFGISVSSIQELNPGVDSSRLKIGQIIRIPSTASFVSVTNQILVTAQLSGVDPQGTFRFITSNGVTYAAKTSGNMINELFNHLGENVTLTLEGNRGSVMTLVSLQ